VGLLASSHLASMIPAAEAVLRTFADSYSLYAIQSYFEHNGSNMQTFLANIRFLLVHWCEQNYADDVAGLEWLRGAITSFLLLSGDRYLPPSVMGLVDDLAKESNKWKAVLQLYQYMFAIQETVSLAKQLELMIEWYADDLFDESYTAIFDMSVYLRYGDTNKGAAEVRKQDAVAFLSKDPRIPPIVYRLVKHSGLLEERFWSLIDEGTRQKIKEQEVELRSLLSDGPFRGWGAMFLPSLLKSIEKADPSGALSMYSKYPLSSDELDGLWSRITNAAARCSRMSASKDDCGEAIKEAKSFLQEASTSLKKNIEDITTLCLSGLPLFRDWIAENILK
jgi:hypothetical protein